MNGTFSLSDQTNLQNKLLINVALCDAGLKVRILQKAQKKLVDQLEDRANSIFNRNEETFHNQ